jgi:hypothetical protein
VLAAWFAGARFDLAIEELKKGKIFPSNPAPIAGAGQPVAHGEL